MQSRRDFRLKNVNKQWSKKLARLNNDVFFPPRMTKSVFWCRTVCKGITSEYTVNSSYNYDFDFVSDNEHFELAKQILNYYSLTSYMNTLQFEILDVFKAITSENTVNNSHVFYLVSENEDFKSKKGN